MKFFEYKSPDDRVLINEETLSYGSTIYSRRRLNLYLVEKQVGEAIQQYNSVEDKSQIPILMDDNNNQINFNDIKSYLQSNYQCNSDNIIIIEHNTDK